MVFETKQTMEDADKHRWINAAKKLYKIPLKNPLLPAQGNAFTDEEWAGECLRRNMIRDIKRAEQTKNIPNVPDDLVK